MKRQDKKETVKLDKGIHREVMLGMGVYNVHREKAYRDKTKYSRKDKHKGKKNREGD